MNEPTISLRDVKAWATNFHRPNPAEVSLPTDALFALVEAVEAAQRVNAAWHGTNALVAALELHLDALDAALARFSDVGTEAGT